MGKLLTQDEFIKKATARHGEKYGLSKSLYIHSKQKLTVTCLIHGDFLISPNMLLKGIGCPDCGGTKKLTHQQFIENAKQTHGDRYDYSKTIYKNYETKIEIVCNIHGSFFQTPHRHLDGGGCSSCGGSKPLDTKEFIKRAIAIHGNEFDYSKVIYSNTKSEVEIICKKHGAYMQSAGGHLNGYKCKRCSGNHNPTTLEFIEKANLIHKEYYSYDKVEYKSAHSPVTITCNLHGDFRQTPNSHLKGSECSLCSLLKMKNPTNLPTSKTLTEEFIKQGHLRHGHKKYDYSKAIYLNNKTKITIGCKLHGWTQQFPNAHLKGVGCSKCANEETAKQNRKDITYFLDKAKEVHGKKYSYKQTTFVRMRNLTTIICKKHGEFQQAAYAHLRGQGCPKCKESQGERIIRVFLETQRTKYVYQKNFGDCKNQSFLFFDFYLPKQNLLIEYDGEQHFKTTKGNTFGGEVGFEKRKINDAIKTSYAKTKNIKLLRINFRQLKSIEQILSQELCGNS
jgi:hypothetical protein